MSGFRSFAILPAAGRSARMGSHKLLLPWQGRTLIDHVLDVWKASEVTCTVIVVRADDTRLIDVCRRHDVHLVLPELAPAEMKISVQLALRQIDMTYAPLDTDVWLLAPADLPQLNVQPINRVLQAYDPIHPRLILPAYQGRRGHPALFPWTAARDVAQLGPAQGVNALIDTRDILEIACDDDSILHDIDTPEDYMRASRLVSTDAGCRPCRPGSYIPSDDPGPERRNRS